MLDGDERAAVAVTRSLVRRGHVVTVGAAQRRSLAAVVRGARGLALRSSPLADPRAFAAEVGAQCRALGIGVLLPITDASLEAVLEHRADLPTTLRLPFADLAVYQAASDKRRVHELADRLGIGVPGTIVLERPDDRVPSVPGLFPAVVKPHRSVVGHGTRLKTRVRIVADAEACDVALRALPAAAFPVLVQPRIIGPGEGYFCARWQGRVIARFAHRRLREKPPSGGVSVFREAIAADPEVAAACERLLDALGWEGVAMIEGKRDAVTGRWSVMEINGRFWGSLQLAIDAGVDFPRLLLEAAEGASVEPPLWRAGVRLRWEWGDLDHLLLRLVRSRARLQLPPDAPGRLGALGAFLAHRGGRDRFELCRWGDAGPFRLETLRRFGLAR